MENEEERVIFSKYQGNILPTQEIEGNAHKKHKKVQFTRVFSLLTLFISNQN